MLSPLDSNAFYLLSEIPHKENGYLRIFITPGENSGAPLKVIGLDGKAL